MSNKCLYCYKDLNREGDFHKKCSRSFFGMDESPLIDYSIDQMDELARQVVQRSIAVPGVQAKLSMSLIKELKNHSHSRLTVVGALGGQYIFKPPSDLYREMPENEHLSMRLTELFGIPVVPSSLIRLSSGELSYITKRIDRKASGDKIHMMDMFQITEAFDKYRSSMERISKALDNYSYKKQMDKILLFEMTVFCYLIGNNDMHLKNFSMIEDAYGWCLAPAYDLLNVKILIPEDEEELALTLSGKKRKFKREHFVEFAQGMGLSEKQIQNVFQRFIKGKVAAKDLINHSFLSEEMKKSYLELMEERYALLVK
jgi:serine/threonine-protein kinase HipA